eukprot:5788812-Pleurochrysis_carterae.AAC.2
MKMLLEMILFVPSLLASVQPLQNQLTDQTNVPKKPPHIFFVLVDDLGWGDVGFNRAESSKYTLGPDTPTMDLLVKEGVQLERHYVHMMCTPSRAALQTGRLPVHIITELAEPCDANGAIPYDMTGITEHLVRAGYATHQVGKWDAGMATPRHTPRGRGYQTSLNYFGHGNWMWSEAEWGGSESGRADVPQPDFYDLWDTDRPAYALRGTGFEEKLFRERMLSILHAHDPSVPLFLNYDSRLVHYPLQAPPEFQHRYAAVADENRRLYYAMVSYLDDQLANITNTMRALGLWEATLMVLSSDNGGYVKAPMGACNTTHSASASPASDLGHGTTCFNGEAGANNYPLRGGKYSLWEGGIRVAAFVSGGFLPAAVRGTKLQGMVHIADWYGTLCALARVDARDARAAAAGLPPIDSVDVWPMLSGRNLTSPRRGFLVNADAIVLGEWKYVRGGTQMIGAAWGGPQYPNASTATDPVNSHTLRCPPQGCLFNVVRDKTERFEVSSDNEEVVATLARQLEEEAARIWQTSHAEDPRCRD